MTAPSGVAAPPVRPTDPDALADLEEQRDFLLRSLEDLERERAAGDVDAHDFETLRDDYTARAAAVLRAIESGRAALPPPTRAPGRRRLAVGLGVAAFAVVAGLGVAAAAGTRLTGDSSSGDIRTTSGQKLADAAELHDAGEVLEAIELYDEVLAERPDHPVALAYKGWALVDAGSGAGEQALVDRGVGLLEQAIAADPAYPDAHFFRGYVHLRLEDDPDGALREFRLVLDSDPPAAMAGQARMVVGDLESGGDGIPDDAQAGGGR